MERSDGIVRWAQIGLALAAWLYVAGILIQVFLAGLGIFDSAERWSDHRTFGSSLGILPVLMVILALVGRLKMLTIGLSVATLILYGLQFTFANAGNGSVAALHPVNALVMFWITIVIAQRAQRLAFPGGWLKESG